MNEYELRRERRIASNRARLAELDLCNLASRFNKEHIANPGHRKRRAPKTKGAAPTRKSKRPTKSAHDVLSEVILSGEAPTEGLRYRLSRKRFESESMPLKRKAQHEFGEAFEFTNEATQSAAEEWFQILRLQPELSAASWESTCETLAFNLGQEGLTKHSLAGGTQETATLIYNTAVFGIEPIPLGTQLAMKRVLQHLMTGWGTSCGLPAPALSSKTHSGTHDVSVVHR